MNQKLLYTAPEAEPLVIRIEGMICQSKTGSSGFGESGNVTDRSDEEWW